MGGIKRKIVSAIAKFQLIFRSSDGNVRDFFERKQYPHRLIIIQMSFVQIYVYVVHHPQRLSSSEVAFLGFWRERLFLYRRRSCGI